jgi:hypothetical protein
MGFIKSNFSFTLGLAHPVRRVVYSLDSRGIGVQLPAGARNSSLLHSIQAVSGGYRGLFPWGSIMCGPVIATLLYI